MDERQLPEKEEYQITFSTKTVIRVLLVIAAAGFLYVIKEVVAVFLAGLFLAALIDPMADYFEAKKIPRGLAVILIYFIGVVILGGVLTLVVPPVLLEIKQFLSFLAPSYNFNFDITFSVLTLNLPQMVETVRNSGFSSAVPQIIDITTKAFQAISAFVLTLIFAFYFVAEKGALLNTISFFTPPSYQPFAGQVAMKMRDRLGSWLRGQLILMLIIFTLSYVVFSILGLPFALVLALLAGLLEAVPFVGPFISGSVAFVVALAISPLHAVAAVLGSAIIQSVENAIVPKIMQKATGMNPVITLLAVLIGGHLGGIVGAILAIPLANATAVFMNEVFFNKTSSSS